MSRLSAAEQMSARFNLMHMGPPGGAGGSESASAPLYAVAVDFGTARSGLAFGIFAAPDSVTAHQATSQFTEMCDDQKARVLLFHQFKMQLFDEKGMRPAVPAYNDAACKVPVVTLIARAIEYMRDEALRYLDTRYGAGRAHKISAAEVQWMITVPTVWSDGGKQMMREAAVQAGLIPNMSSRRLCFALEPEAASIWCRRQMELDGLKMKTGDKFIIMDCGGGTVDSVVMEVSSSGGTNLKKFGGGPWGSKGINERFEQFLRELVSKTIYDKFCQQEPHEHYVFIENFENRTKHRLKPFTDYAPNETVAVRLPQALMNLCEDEGAETLAEMCDTYSDEHDLSGAHRLKCSSRNFQLEMPVSLLRTLFQPLLDQIASHARSLLSEYRDVKYFLLVGGFAACPPLVRALEEVCKGVVKVTTTQDPALAVVLGAALQQLNSPIEGSSSSAALSIHRIGDRPMPATYGCSCSALWTSENAADHRSKRLMLNDKTGELEERCSVFSVFKRAGEPVKDGELVSHKFCPTENECEFTLLKTDAAKVKYPDDRGVVTAGTLCITLPKKPGQYFADRRIRLDMRFGAEITVTATEEATNTTVQCSIDFLIG